MTLQQSCAFLRARALKGIQAVKKAFERLQRVSNWPTTVLGLHLHASCILAAISVMSKKQLSHLGCRAQHLRSEIA